MQFTLISKHQGDPDSKSWPEEYNVDTDNPQEWAEATIKRFNATLQRGERPRTLLRVEIKTNNVPLKHDWHKTNLITISKNGSYYDTYRCTRCGATGKRFSLDGGVHLDAPKKYPEGCKGPTVAPQPSTSNDNDDDAWLNQIEDLLKE